MHDLLSAAKKKGATDAEVSIEQDKGFSIDVRLNEVETLSFSDDQSITIAVYLGHQKGVASTSELNPLSLDKLIDKALCIAKMSAPDPCFGLADKDFAYHEHLDLDLYHPWSISTEEAIDMAKTCEKIALSQDKAIVNSDGVHISTYTGCVGYANTREAEGIVYSSKHQLSCSLVAEGQDGKLQRDYDYTVSRIASTLTSPDDIAKNAALRALKKRDSKKIKTQRAPILFSSRIASHLISTFISAISGSSLYKKQSFLLNSLNQSIFPKWVHIQEEPYLLQGLGSAPFDGEGSKTRNNVFVNDGQVKQYVLSSYTARRLGLKTSANAGGVHNLFVTPNFQGLDDLIQTMRTGFLVTELMGQGINLQTGDYSRGASGFWIENGEIMFPVEEVTIAGNLKDMYQHIIGIGADSDPNRATRCGSILIESMTIAGD